MSGRIAPPDSAGNLAQPLEVAAIEAHIGGGGAAFSAVYLDLGARDVGETARFRGAEASADRFEVHVDSIHGGQAGGHSHACRGSASGRSLLFAATAINATGGGTAQRVLPPGCLPSWALFAETCVVVVVSFYAILATEARTEPVAHAPEVGGAMSAVLTLWCNALLMRLSSAAQRSAGPEHSIMCPCPYTAQISWVAIQTGCVAGSALSFVLRMGAP